MKEQEWKCRICKNLVDVRPSSGAGSRTTVMGCRFESEKAAKCREEGFSMYEPLFTKQKSQVVLIVRVSDQYGGLLDEEATVREVQDALHSLMPDSATHVRLADESERSFLSE